MDDLSRNTLTLVLGGGRGERLYPLTRDRAKPAVPFGGGYRIVDFTLSNCFNSGLRRICLLTQYKSISLDRHLRASWNVFHEEMGEFLICVPPQQRVGARWYAGTADAIFQNIYTLQQERPRRTLILGGDHIYKMDYSHMLRFHDAREAFVTVACVVVPIEEGRRFGVMEVDKAGRVRRFVEKPEDPPPLPGQPGYCLASMGIYVFETRFLVRAVAEDARGDSEHDFGKDILPGIIRTYPVYAYPLSDDPPGSYWRDIGTLTAYWEASMDMLGAAPRFDVADSFWPVRSNPGHRAPARITGDAEVRDSLVGAGAIIEGACVHRSIIAPGAYIGPGAEVTESVIFEDVRIEGGARLRKTILDKINTVPPGARIGLDEDEDRRRFAVAPGHITVVPKDVPSNLQFWMEGGAASNASLDGAKRPRA